VGSANIRRTLVDFIGTLGSDAALLLFSAAGLIATTVAILFDTRSQRTELAKANVRFEG
jgi:hypothetical protein